MDLVVRTIEEAIGTVRDEELAHSFHDDKELSFGGHKVRHLDSSRIDADPDVKFVFFKIRTKDELDNLFSDMGQIDE